MFKKQVKCSDCGFLAIKGFEEFIQPGATNALKMLQIFNYYGSIGFQECPMEGRKKITDGTHKALGSLTCARELWYFYPENRKDNSYLLNVLTSERKCCYFFSYHPGYHPAEHKDLERERAHRKFLVFVSLLSAAVGAAIATLVNLVWS